MRDVREFIKSNTRVKPPHLCPEMRLHLIDDSCPLWKATERELVELGLPDPYWGFCWAGGQALARHIIDNPGLVFKKRVLDFGAGCGVEGIAALLSGAESVLAADIDPFAAEACRMNGHLNGYEIGATTENLIGSSLDGIDLVLAGDMFYDPAFSKMVLDWFGGLCREGVDVLLADPGRGNLGAMEGLERLAEYMAPADVDVDGRHLIRSVVYRMAGCGTGDRGLTRNQRENP
jgi:predicted nicotinamide N-methyase